MLDLKASYEPIQEASYIRSASTNNNANKPASKSDSFQRILNKTNQRNLNKKQVVRTDNDSNIRRKEDIYAPKTELDQAAKKAAAVLGKANQQDKTSLEQDQSDLLDLKETKPEAPELNQSDENAEPNTGILIAMPQVSVAKAEVAEQSNSDRCEESTKSVATAISKPEELVQQANDVQSMKLPIASETEIAQEVPGLIVAPTELKLGDQINGAVPVEINNDTSAINATGSVAPSPLNNELKASEQDLSVSQSEKQVQHLEPNLATIQPGTAATDIATTEQAIMADLIENPTDSSSTPKPANSSPENDATNVVLSLAAQALELAEPDKPAGNRSIAQNLTKPITATEGSQENSNLEKVNKVLTPKDIQIKLIEKTLLDSSQKPGEDQSTTDIKKLMATESQRLSAAKPVAEESTSTEAPVSKNQAETPATVSGLERAVYTPAKTGLEPQTVAPQSPASTVDPKDLIEQIVKKAEMLTKTNSSEIKIQLKPEFMGKMTIKIAVEDGLITAKFITESQQVKHLLEANLGSLKQNLESQGLKVDRTEVNVQLDNGGSFHGDDSGRQQMWQEYAERNNYNRSSYQREEGYANSTSTAFEPYEEAAPIIASPRIGDGKVDFMI